MGKREKWLAFLTAMLMFAGIVLQPLQAEAVNSAKVFICPNGYGISGGKPVFSNIWYLVNPDGTLNETDADASNYNIYYDEENGILTINNLQLQVEDKWLMVPGSTTIKVLGINRIEPPEDGK